MNLLIYFHYFAPSVGGVESIVQSLAAGVAELRTLDGDNEFNVTVVTETAAGNYDDSKFPFRVVRRPGVISAPLRQQGIPLAATSKASAGKRSS
jgi:hypothetical protein